MRLMKRILSAAAVLALSALFWLAAAAARRALFPFLQVLPQKALFLP